MVFEEPWQKWPAPAMASRTGGRVSRGLYAGVMSKQPRPFRSVQTPQSKPAAPASAGAPVEVPARLDPRAAATDLPPERGGYSGPEPTRFGDWEHKGRCTDF